MQFYEYKGYTIYPAPHFVVGSGRWRTEIVIKYGTIVKKYGDDKFFFTKGEAVFHSIQFGKTLIDQGIILFGEAV